MTKAALKSAHLFESYEASDRYTHPHTNIDLNLVIPVFLLRRLNIKLLSLSVGNRFNAVLSNRKQSDSRGRPGVIHAYYSRGKSENFDNGTFRFC